MAGIRLFNVHRTWEDWVGMVLGVLIADSDEDGQLFRLKTDSYSDR